MNITCTMQSSSRTTILSVISTALLLLCAVVFVSVDTTLRNWDNQFATAVADPDSAAPGDGSHAVPITSTEVLSVGQSANLDALRITVISANKITQVIRNKDGLPVTPAGYVNWEVRFSIENVSSETKHPHPSVDSQIQYAVNGIYTWRPEDEGDCVPSIVNGLPMLDRGAKFECIFIYYVPQNDQPVYWVFSTSGYESSVVFRVR